MSKNKNMNSLNETDLNQVSGGAVGPDPLWYAVNVKGVKIGSNEFNNICNENGVDPTTVTMKDINNRQNEREKYNANLNNNF